MLRVTSVATGHTYELYVGNALCRLKIKLKTNILQSVLVVYFVISTLTYVHFCFNCLKLTASILSCLKIDKTLKATNCNTCRQSTKHAKHTSDDVHSKQKTHKHVTCCRCCRISCLFSDWTFASWTVSSAILLRSSLIFNRSADNTRRLALFDTLPPRYAIPTLELRLTFWLLPSWLAGGLLWPTEELKHCSLY